jgi:hypothetical protein
MDCFVALLASANTSGSLRSLVRDEKNHRISRFNFQSRRHKSTFPRRETPELCINLRPTEGAGNAGRSMRPQPRMQSKKAYEHSHHGHTGFTRHSPRNGFNGFLRALPGDRALLSPSSAEISSANLTPASRRQDHTTSPSASRAVRPQHISVHRIPSRVRDDREPPLVGTRRRGL